MGRHIAIGTLVLWFVFTPPCVAEEEKPIDCSNATATAELNFCAEKDFNKADASLNAIYEAALKKISKHDWEPPYDAKSFEKAMRNAQRAWLAYRDADCKDLVPMAWTGGSATSAEVLGCLTSKTKARAEELKERYLME